MLGLIVRKELLEGVLSFRFIIVFPTMVVLISIGLLVGLNEYRARVEAGRSIAQLNREQLERSTDWSQVGREGIFVFKSPSPLMVFAVGVSGIVGEVAKIVDHDVPALGKGRFTATATFTLFGSWDFHFVVRVVLSLAALLFAYDLISGEKEAGTLRLLLSNPCPRSHLILGKAFGRFILLVTAFSLAFLIGLIPLSIAGDVTYTVEHRWRILFIFLGFLTYMGVFFAIGLLASCLTNHSVVSLLSSLFMWVLLVFVVPRGSFSIASLLHPVPTPAELEAKRAALVKDMATRLTLSLEEPMRRWMSRPPSGTPIEEQYRRQQEYEKEAGRLRQLFEAERDEKLYRLYEDYRNAHKTLDRTATFLSRLSPSACYDYFLTELTETGPRDADSFLDQLIAYQKRFSRFISDKKLGQEIIYVVYVKEDPFELTRPRLSEIPPFEYRNRSWRERWTIALKDFALLGLYIAVLFFGSYTSFLKYDPR
jgi:ABC-type transport system involved in multi-copper enzyme maturation permease subunit